jgi:hypothetical protein
MDKPEPQHSWNSFALVDSLSALEGLVSVLPIKTVLKELLQVLHWQKQGLADKHNKGVKMDRILYWVEAEPNWNPYFNI